MSPRSELPRGAEAVECASVTSADHVASGTALHGPPPAPMPRPPPVMSTDLGLYTIANDAPAWYARRELVAVDGTETLIVSGEKSEYMFVAGTVTRSEKASWWSTALLILPQFQSLDFRTPCQGHHLQIFGIKQQVLAIQ